MIFGYTSTEKHAQHTVVKLSWNVRTYRRNALDMKLIKNIITLSCSCIWMGRTIIFNV